MRRIILALLVLVVLISLVVLAGCKDPVEPGLVLYGGRVITLDSSEPAGATAVLMRNGRIEIVGQDAEVLAAARPDDHRDDLDGAVVVPGFGDSHCHLYGLGKALVQIDLVGTVSAAACADLVAAAAAEATPGAWLEGRGWDQNDWSEAVYPDRSLLDAVGGGRPCYLRRVDGHAAWVNSAALAAAGITADTPDPAGGLILRDDHGEPTGILVDNAVDLMGDVVPEPTREERRRRVHLAVEHCLAHGITAVHDAGISWETLGLYRKMAAAGELKLRYYGMLNDEPETIDSGLAAGPLYEAGGLLTVRAVKLYADGALGSRGALLLEDYTDEPGRRGLPVTAHAHLDSVARRAAAAGFQVCTHAIGDAANRLVLDIYEEIFLDLGSADRRWRVEHAQILDPADLPRFGELGVIAAMQPVHCTSDMDWAHERLGHERLAGAYAWRSLLDSGAHICSGTDFPVERVSALAGLYASRTRTHADGTPLGGWHPEEKLDGRTALELYTAGSAYAAFAEDEVGRITPGYRADLTVLDGDPVSCEPAELLNMKVIMTVVDGIIRYEGP